jgi:hypothetical protein
VDLFSSSGEERGGKKDTYSVESLRKSSPQVKSESKSKLYYDRRSVGQSVLVSGTHLGSVTNFSFFLSLIIFLFLIIFRQLRICSMANWPMANVFCFLEDHFDCVYVHVCTARGLPVSAVQLLPHSHGML